MTIYFTISMSLSGIMILLVLLKFFLIDNRIFNSKTIIFGIVSIVLLIFQITMYVSNNIGFLIFGMMFQLIYLVLIFIFLKRT